MAGRPLGLVHQPGPPDGFRQCGPDRRIQHGQGIGQGRRRDPGGGPVDVVEAGGVFAHRGRPATADIVTDGADLCDRGVGVQPGPRQYPGQPLPGQGGGRLPAKIDSG